MRYELSDFEWAAIKPFLPNKPRGVPRVNDRRVLDACHAAIKTAKAEKGHESEMRAALLYQHALRCDGSDDERHQILAGAMLAIPIPASFKSERIRFRKSKFGEGGELYIAKDGKREIWRQWTPASELKQRKARHKKAAKA